MVQEPRGPLAKQTPAMPMPSTGPSGDVAMYIHAADVLDVLDGVPMML